MPKFFKEHFLHFVLFLLDVLFRYLHKTYDVYYDLECEEFFAYPKEGDVDDEKSGI